MAADDRSPSEGQADSGCTLGSQPQEKGPICGMAILARDAHGRETPSSRRTGHLHPALEHVPCCDGPRTRCQPALGARPPAVPNCPLGLDVDEVVNRSRRPPVRVHPWPMGLLATWQRSAARAAHHPVVKNEYKRTPMKARNTTRLR